LPRDQMEGVRPHVLRGLMRAFYRSASAIVAVSKSVAESVSAGLGIPPQRIRTIYNPVVTPELHAKATAPLDDPWFQPGTPPVVLGVGRLAPQKDFSTLLRAFAEVRATRPARLAILGEGAERPALEALARQLGVADHVRLLGFDHNPFRYMHRSAVFALSSMFEGLPGALIQAMACGCRVISTDCPGGSREILQGGELGPLVPMRDPHALAAGISRLLADAERGPARLALPVDRFTEKGAVDAYLDVLGVGTA
jgi:glycosyltransferase involved in cell wall biosynthesis